MLPYIAPLTPMSGITGDHVLPLLLIGVSVWVARGWVRDYRAALGGTPNDKSFPGATPVSALAVTLASVGTLVILAAETGGEYVLGVSAEQSKVTGLFALYSICGAPVIEEVVFRGYLVIENRGRLWLWAGVVGISSLFAVRHPFLWTWNGDGLTLHVGAKPWFSTAMVFTVSLWFYTMRFFRLNPERSLLPCFVAHATKNLGVFAVKYVQGFVGAW